MKKCSPPSSYSSHNPILLDTHATESEEPSSDWRQFTYDVRKFDGILSISTYQNYHLLVVYNPPPPSEDVICEWSPSLSLSFARSLPGLVGGRAAAAGGGGGCLRSRCRSNRPPLSRRRRRCRRAASPPRRLKEGNSLRLSLACTGS